MAEITESNVCIRGCCSSKTIPLHLPSSSFSLLSTLAKGSESIVYNALLNNKRVAAKKPILSTSDDLDKFHRELQLWCKVEHPGLAKFVAAHAKPPNYLLFFEFYERGNLADRLHVEEWSPRIDETLLIAYELARSLQYLHNLGIIHRDIKPSNVLLDNELHPHIADFGLATYKIDLKHVSLNNWKSSGKPTGGFHKKNMVGTIIYMAPEILKKEIHTEKSDVYSFAVTFNELLTGVVPYTDLRAETQAHTVLEMNYTEQQLTAAVVSENLRPAIADAPPSLISLIQRCWDPLPINRPCFLDIVNELHMIIHQLGKINPGVEISDKPSSPQTKNSVPSFHENLNWFVRGEQLIKKISINENSIANVWQDFENEPLHYIPTLSWGSFSTLGRRETMEDAHFLHPRMCNKNDIHAFGIFDGHRGAAAAEFSVRVLPGFLQSFDHCKSPSEALTEAFIKTDVAFRTELNLHRHNKRITKKDWHPGCTAITSLIVRNKLFVANAGDCRVILCRKGHPFPLSKEHVASCPDERKRVMSEGVGVKWLVDTWRVGPAALQVTRSIGDDDLKPAVTAKPEITETLLSEGDDYLVMASDGLWDVMSNDDVISIVKDTVKEPSMCSKRLATEAAARGSGDNITVIVVFLRPVSTAERIY